MRKALILTAALALCAASASAQTVQRPGPGTAERKAILDAVRPIVEAQVGPPVEFVVSDIRVAGAHAFVILQPQRPGGGRIDYSHLDRASDGMMDGLRTEALLTRRNGRWLVTEHAIGATDVWYVALCGRYPRGLIPSC